MPARYRVLLLLTVLSVITYLDRVCIAVAGPRIQKELQLSAQEWGWVVGAFALAYGVFEIPGGWLGDRIGPRLCLMRIVLWWSAFTALTGVVTGFVSLVLTRFAFGAGEAGAYPNMSVAIRKWFADHERGRAFGVIWMASQSGGVLAGILVAPLQIAFGWRTSFFVFGLAGVAWAIVWWAFYRDPVTEHELASVAPRPVVGAVSGVVSQTGLWTLVGIAFCYCYAMYFFLAWMPTYLAESRGFKDTDLSFSALPFLLGAAANGGGGWLSDAMVRQFGRQRGRQLLGFAALAVAAMCVFGAIVTADRWICVGLLSICYGAIGLQQPAVWATCTEISRRSTGTAAGVMNSAAQAGSFTMGVSFGYLRIWLGSYDRALIPLGGALIIGALLWLRMQEERSEVS